MAESRLASRQDLSSWHVHMEESPPHVTTVHRYKVYVGQTSSLKRRFYSEYRGVAGSHLRPFFDEALKNGCQVWRRFKVMVKHLLHACIL